MEINNEFQIIKINYRTNKWKILYDRVPTLEKAYILAQDAMQETSLEEVIFISPGVLEKDFFSAYFADDVVNYLKEKYKAEE